MQVTTSNRLVPSGIRDNLVMSRSTSMRQSTTAIPAPALHTPIPHATSQLYSLHGTNRSMNYCNNVRYRWRFPPAKNPLPSQNNRAEHFIAVEHV